MIWELKLWQIMNKSLFTFSPSTEINQAMSMLIKRKYSGAPVIDAHGKLIGILTQKDCLKALLNSHYHNSKGGNVSDYMTPDVETLDSNMDLFEVAQRFVNSNYRRFPVIENNQLIGMVTRFDLLQSINE